MTEERFELTETLDIKDNLTAVIYPVDIIRNHPKQICALLNELDTEKNTIKQNILTENYNVKIKFTKNHQEFQEMLENGSRMKHNHLPKK